MKRPFYSLIFMIVFSSCSEESPDYDQWWVNVQEPIQETDDNDLNVMDEGESKDEVIIEPIDDDIVVDSDYDENAVGNVIITEGNEAELESFRMKAYIRFKPLEKIPARVNILATGQLKLPKRIHVLSDNNSINTGQIASIRHNTTEYCYHGVQSDNPEENSYFILKSFKTYDPDYNCVVPRMDLKMYYRDDSQLMENGAAYISNVDTARIRYGYFSTKNEIATLAMKNVNSTLYVGLPVDTMPKPNKLNKAKNWVFGLKLIPSSSQTSRFSIAAIKGIKVFRPSLTYKYAGTTLSIKFTNTNKLQFSISGNVVAETELALTGLTALETVVQSKYQVLPIMKAGVTKNLPDALDSNAPPTIDINSGDYLEFAIGSRGSSQQDAVAKARFESI